MFGIILASLSSLFKEASSSIGKNEVAHHRESMYMMGFINLSASAIFLSIVGLVRHDFIFSLASLPTFGIRIVLEILQCYLALKAVTLASRGTFGFLRTLTIPLLLAVDVVMGYDIALGQIIGIGIIALGLIFLFINHGIEKKGAWWVAASAINAVATVSLYKYDITNFNSVEAEQTLMIAILLIYFFILIMTRTTDRPWHIFTHRKFLWQSLAEGAGSVVSSFAYNFSVASIIMAVERASAIFWSIISGNVFFKEKKFFLKAITMILFITGIVLVITQTN